MALVAVMGGAMILPQLYPPLGDAWQRMTYGGVPTKLPAIPDLIAMRYRHLLGETDYAHFCREQGLTTEWANKIYNASQQLMQAGDLIAAWRRKIIAEKSLDWELNELGFTPERIQVLKAVTMYYPGPQDLITWQAREVFEADAIAKYGLEDELELVNKDAFYKIGMDDEQISNYWKAHWEHPGWQAIREMLHRTDLTEKDVWDWFRIVEIPPYWRDRYVKIAYNPFTRVDVRRMWRIGVLDDSQLDKSYMDLGYDKWHAEKMSEFTKKYETRDDVGLTRASVIRAFKADLITLDDLLEYLKRLDYSGDVIMFWLAMAVYEKDQEAMEDAVADLLELFRMGDMDEVALRVEMAKLDLPSEYIESLMLKEGIKKAKKRKIPSREDITTWLQLRIISEEHWFTAMSKLGYREEDAIRYLEETAMEVDVSKRQFLKIETYMRWLEKDMITVDLFTLVADAMGHTEDDITKLISIAKGAE